MSIATRALIGLAAGLAAGLVANATGAAWLRDGLAAVEPLGTLWVNAIRMTVLPLMFSLLVSGVASTGDARTVGRIGRRAVVAFATFLSAAALLTALVSPPMFELVRLDPSATAALRAEAAGAMAGAREVPPFSDWVVSLVPTNPVRAAVDTAMLPLIVFAIAFGIALTRIRPERGRPVVRFFESVAAAMLLIVRWVLAWAPVGVFALALGLARVLGASAAGAVGTYIAIMVALVVIGLIVSYAVAVLVGGVRLREFARASLPAQTVAFTARSSLAALPAMLEGADRRLRLPADVTGVVLPLAVSTFKLGSPLSWLPGALFAAKLYGIELTLPDIALISAASVILSVSVPGIPSGGLLMQAPVFLAVGLPVEGIGILIALDAVPDIVKSVLNVTADMSVVTVVARGHGAVAARDAVPRPVALGDDVVPVIGEPAGELPHRAP